MLEIPENLNIADYYLDRNLTVGRGDNTAIYYKEKTYSYAQIAALSNRVGNVLKQLGVEPEDRVLLAINDSPEFVITWYGIIKIGLSPRMSTPFFTRMITPIFELYPGKSRDR